MAFLYIDSCDSLKSKLSLFELPPTQTVIKSSQWVQYKPISSITDQSPIEFTIPGSCEYLDLAHTMLSLRVSVIPVNTLDSKNATPTVGPVNNFMHSLFNQVDVFFNQKPVSPPNNTYAYKSYIGTLLNDGPAAKNSHLTSVLWADDTAGKMDDTTRGNEGFKKRQKIMVDNKINLFRHLHADVLNQDRLLLSGAEVRVRLVRSRDSFCLMDPDSINTVNITEATLFVRRLKISPNILLAHEKMLSKVTAKYPHTRVEVKAVTLHSDIHCEKIYNVILRQLPKRIIIGFVENKAYNGDSKLNPQKL